MAGLTHASPTVDVVVPLAGRRRRISPGFEAWRKFRRHRMAVASVVILTVLTSAVLLGPLIWRVPINEIDFTARLSPPDWQHPFGTDDLGQDLLARMLYGGRISLAVGFAAMAVAIIAGTLSARYRAFPAAASTPC
jgi:peptide/nickel transport system permease protein